jgi:hypothetical protein
MKIPILKINLANKSGIIYMAGSVRPTGVARRGFNKSDAKASV